MGYRLLSADASMGVGCDIFFWRRQRGCVRVRARVRACVCVRAGQRTRTGCRSPSLVRVSERVRARAKKAHAEKKGVGQEEQREIDCLFSFFICPAPGGHTPPARPHASHREDHDRRSMHAHCLGRGLLK